MTELRAYDAANPAISIPAMVKHGAIVAPVYIRGNPGGFQPSDAKRVAALRKAGLAPWPNWEQQADFFRTCSIADAKWAGQDAREACLRLGFPDDGTISVPFSFDYDVAETAFSARLARLLACQEGLGDGFQATSYAEIALINYFGANGFGNTGHWLMASTFRQSSQFTAEEIASPHVAMVQSHNAHGDWLDTPIAGTDVNTVTRPNILAAWWPDGHKPAPTPRKGHEMLFYKCGRGYYEWRSDGRVFKISEEKATKGAAAWGTTVQTFNREFHDLVLRGMAAQPVKVASS